MGPPVTIVVTTLAHATLLIGPGVASHSHLPMFIWLRLEIDSVLIN